jgi:hypothetical protein
MKNIKFIAIWCALLSFNSLHAQEVFGGVPYTFMLNTHNPNAQGYVQLTNSIETTVLPNYTNARLQAYADSAMAVCNCGEWAYGKNIWNTIDIISNGTQQVINGMHVYRYRVRSENALALQFYFNSFDLPEDASLYIYSYDKSKLYGALNHESNALVETDGFEMSTIPLKGNDWVLEYNVPDSIPQGELVLGSVVHVFSTLGRSSAGYNWWDCQIDANCPEGALWSAEKKSTILISMINSQFQLATTCSGNLINATHDSGKEKYAVSAGHCFKENITNADSYVHGSLMFYYHYLWKTCRNNGDHDPFTFFNSSSGCIVKTAKNTLTHDYALLETGSSQNTMRSYQVCWAGWDRNQALNSNYPYTLLHHPNGWEMKIAQTPDGSDPDIGNGFVNPVISPSGNFIYTRWNWGVTEPASSGSGLFNSQRRLVGNLTGGPAQCVAGNNGGQYNLEKSWFAKFNRSWDDGSLFLWLNDNNSGAPLTCNTFCSPLPSTGNPANPVSPAVTGANNEFVSFKVNGKTNPNNSVVQVCANQVVLHPDGAWMYSREAVRKKCNKIPNLAEAACYSQGCGVCKCNVLFLKLFISVQECDYNLNLIGPEYMEWKNIYDGSHISCDDEQSASWNIDLGTYAPQGYALQPGKYYRIKVASFDIQQVPKQWLEHSVYIRTLSYDHTIQNQASIGTTQAAEHNITISNSNVVVATPPVNIVAGNEIRIQADSKVSRGRLYISNVTCAYLSTLRTNDTSPNLPATNNATSHDPAVRETNHSDDKREMSTTVTIYPNPTSNEFSIQVRGRSFSDMSAEIFDGTGRKLSTLNFSPQTKEESVSSVNVGNILPGTYLLIVKIDNDVFRYKLIKAKD